MQHTHVRHVLTWSVETGQGFSGATFYVYPRLDIHERESCNQVKEAAVVSLNVCRSQPAFLLWRIGEQGSNVRQCPHGYIGHQFDG